MPKQTFSSLLKRVQAINVKTISEQAINETALDIKVSQQEQLFDGLTSTGSEIVPEYSERTIEIKEFKGQPVDRVTLHDTGAWYAAIQAEAKSGKVIITDADPKTADLMKKYSPQILGLGGYYKSRYIATKLNPVFQKLMKDATGL